MKVDAIKAAIRDVKDFPKPGIIFKDISPILQDPKLFHATIDAMAAPYAAAKPDLIIAAEARGFILGAAMAYKLGCGFAMLRKKGKLPWKTEGISYDLEYGSNQMEMHVDSVKPGAKVLLVDDVLATGGTAAAAVKLIERLGGKVIALSCLLELGFLNGRAKLGQTRVDALIPL